MDFPKYYMIKNSFRFKRIIGFGSADYTSKEIYLKQIWGLKMRKLIP